MAHYPKKTIFTPSPGLESPRIDHQSIFSQSPSLPRPQSTILSQLSPPLYDGVSRISSTKLLSSGPEILVPRIVTVNREALESFTDTMKPRNKSPFIRLELMEKKNILLEEENRKLMEINEKCAEISLKVQNAKMKEMESKVQKFQAENLGLIKELEKKRTEINNVEKLLKVHQEQHNNFIADKKTEIDDLKHHIHDLKNQLSLREGNLKEEIETKRDLEGKYEENLKFTRDKNEELRDEQSKLLARLKEVTEKYEEQVQKNQDLDQYYARTMLEYKAEIASIRSQYDTKIQALTISKDKFNEYVTASRYEMDHLKRQLKEKSEEIEKLNNILGRAPVQTDSNGNIFPNEYFNYPTKRYNIDDFGEKISNLLQENEKLNEKVALNEMESSNWRTKFLALEEKLKQIHMSQKKENFIQSQAYLNSEQDVEDNGALKEKSLNIMKSSTKNLQNTSNAKKNNAESRRPSYKLVARTQAHSNNSHLMRGSASKENMDWGSTAKVFRNTSGGLGVNKVKIERNLSYSIKKNY